MLKALGDLWKQNPDWRLGQLIVNVGRSEDPFYVEDDVMDGLLRERLADDSPAAWRLWPQE